MDSPLFDSIYKNCPASRYMAQDMVGWKQVSVGTGYSAFPGPFVQIR